MRIVIDTRKGISGDIFCGGLIGLGASEKRMISAMEYAGNHLGKTVIKVITEEGVTKLNVKIETDYAQLYASEAKNFLKGILNDLNICSEYRNTAEKTLEILCDAERHVHYNNKKLKNLRHACRESTYDSIVCNSESALHEAKDILIDLAGLSAGLQDLGITKIEYLDYVNAGNGTVNFSHGEFKVPAPATEYIMNKYMINWKKSETGGEMTTPTGASIIAGCDAKRSDSLSYYTSDSKDNKRIIKKALSKGTKNLPEISFYLLE